MLSVEQAFPGKTSGELTDLRDVFARKAFVARQAQLCDALLRAGRTADEVAALRLTDLEPGPDVDRCRALRAELGIDASPGAPAFVLPDGRALDASGLHRWLRLARLVRLSIEGNAGLCRALPQRLTTARSPARAFRSAAGWGTATLESRPVVSCSPSRAGHSGRPRMRCRRR